MKKPNKLIEERKTQIGEQEHDSAAKVAKAIRKGQRKVINNGNVKILRCTL